MKRRTISRIGVVLLLWAAAGGCAAALGETYLVKDGQPRADVVISAQPARMVKLAGAELQDYLLKISGANLCKLSHLDSDSRTFDELSVPHHPRQSKTGRA